MVLKAYFNLLSFGYTQSSSDHSLFFKHYNDSITALLVYVNDVILAGNNLQEIDHVKAYLDAAFKIKDLHDLKFFLGLEVACSKHGITLYQCKYALDILSDAGYLACKPTTTPMDSFVKLSNIVGDFLSDPTYYRRLVGRLLYLTSTRLDLSFAVQQLSQFLDKPTSAHLQAANRVLCYVKSCPAYGLFFLASSNLTLKAFSDSDWARCPATRKSITVSESSSEVQYRALASTTCELQWLHYLLQDLHVLHSHPALLFYDNKSAL
ncbi:uncharacterized protein LOC116140053 [Pistacia vera]|uniref:uncharacterized protein LOC116140053 n=1 Tax=Pistacia vera TaxID=55513 RepID=UPI001262FB05|nr:uncharacterized protein LOC116140053 [Pistacia vera]